MSGMWPFFPREEGGVPLCRRGCVGCATDVGTFAPDVLEMWFRASLELLFRRMTLRAPGGGAAGSSRCRLETGFLILGAELVL